MKKTKKPNFSFGSYLRWQRPLIYSHDGLIKQIEHFAAVAKTEEQKMATLEIGKWYLREKNKIDRGFYGDDMPHFLDKTTKTKAAQKRSNRYKEILRERLKDRVTRYARAFYRQHYSLEHAFKTVGASPKHKTVMPSRLPIIRTPVLPNLPDTYSHETFMQAIERYGRFAKTREQRQKIRASLDQYKLRWEEKREKRLQSKYNLMDKYQFNQNRLSKEMRTQKNLNEKLDGFERLIIMKDTRKYYHRNFSMTKKFNDHGPKYKPKDCDMRLDKE